MYKNIICFFPFSFINQNIRMGRIHESRRRLNCIHRGWDMNLQWTIFFLFGVGSKCSWLYKISDAHANSLSHTSSCLPWTRFLLACQFRNLYCVFTENKCVLYILGTWWISSYFRSTKVCCCINRGQRGLWVNIQNFLWCIGSWDGLCLKNWPCVAANSRNEKNNSTTPIHIIRS